MTEGLFLEIILEFTEAKVHDFLTVKVLILVEKRQSLNKLIRFEVTAATKVI